jgi:ring-1,2-phenylacetyl-CoA epoxidase subunit PaaE
VSTPHFHALQVASVVAEGEDAKLISFNVPDDLQQAFAFEPGQYITLRHGDERRSYSICAAPGQALRVGVRRVPGGVFSNWLHDHLKPGDWLDVMPPDGRFGAALAARPSPSPCSGPRHVLVVAGGSGITPIIAMLQAVLQGDAQARCTLIYGNRTAASTMFKEALEDLKNRYVTRLALHVVLSREGVDSPLHSGRIDADKMADFLKLCGPVDAAFVCGPHAMNDVVEQALLASGLAPDCVHIERFGVPPSAADATLHAPRAGDATQARITIVRDGVRREIAFMPTDDSILAAAARAGLDVPYSCRSGVCATCRAKLLQGQVRMDRNFALQADEVAAGYVLTCQAHPLTDHVVVSFDER